MKFPRNARIFRGQLDLAPVAGVVFLLVIFLLPQSTLVLPPGVEIRLPEVSGQPLPGPAEPRAVVAMDRQGQIYFDSQLVDAGQLRERLRQAVERTPDLALIIQADQEVRLESFFHLSKLAGEAGLQRVYLSGRPPLPPPPASPNPGP